MNNMKKLASLLLAMIMLLAVAAPAMAAPADTTISVGANDDRTYDVYQIFVGDLSVKTLSNIVWGKNGKGTEGQEVDKAVLKELNDLDDAAADTAKLEVIKKYVDFESDAFGSVSKTASLDVKTGYYLLVDKGAVNPGESYSLYIVQVVGPTTVSPKRGTVESEKKVKDTNDSVANSTTDWQDSADYDIGDKVPFQLTATLPENLADYATYKMVFHDTESKGLTFQNDAKVYVVNGANKVEVKSGFTVEAPAQHVEDEKTVKHTFDVVIANVKALKDAAGNTIAVTKDSKIVVEYTSELNTEAVIGSAGNPNVMYLEYSNNPNVGGDGEYGKTPEDKVIVFTFDVVANKVDENQEPLVGASFTLYKKLNTLPEGAEATDYEVETVDGQNIYWWNLGTVDGTNGFTFKWTGLDDGEYKLVETHTPAGYNTIDPIYFTVSAEHEEEAADPKLESLNVTSSMDTENEDGTTKLAFTADKDKTEGTLSTTVVNEKGVNLPSTGGMGTTLFYLMGAVLLAGAAVVVVSKKRAIEK